MLKVSDLIVYYGSIAAIKGVDITVNEGEVVSIIGANGAGKTTLLKTISGLIQPRDGEIEFENRSIAGGSSHSIVEKGIIHVPEGRAMLNGMTVMENLRLGAFRCKDKKSFPQDLEMVFTLFPRLKERVNQLAGTLSGGEQQMLAIGRALMAKPRLLLMDEPSLGLAPIIVKEIFGIVRSLKEQGITICLVEQNAFQALQIADRGYVFQLGRIVMEDSAANLLNNKEVVNFYLGKSLAG